MRCAICNVILEGEEMDGGLCLECEDVIRHSLRESDIEDAKRAYDEYEEDEGHHTA